MEEHEQTPKYRIRIRPFERDDGYMVDVERYDSGRWYRSKTEYCSTYWGARFKAWYLNQRMRLRKDYDNKIVYEG